MSSSLSQTSSDTIISLPLSTLTQFSDLLTTFHKTIIDLSPRFRPPHPKIKTGANFINLLPSSLYRLFNNIKQEITTINDTEIHVINKLVPKSNPKPKFTIRILTPIIAINSKTSSIQHQPVVIPTDTLLPIDSRSITKPEIQSLTDKNQATIKLNIISPSSNIIPLDSKAVLPSVEQPKTNTVNHSTSPESNKLSPNAQFATLNQNNSTKLNLSSTSSNSNKTNLKNKSSTIKPANKTPWILPNFEEYLTNNKSEFNVTSNTDNSNLIKAYFLPYEKKIFPYLHTLPELKRSDYIEKILTANKWFKLHPAMEYALQNYLVDRTFQDINNSLYDN